MLDLWVTVTRRHEVTRWGQDNTVGLCIHGVRAKSPQEVSCRQILMDGRIHELLPSENAFVLSQLTIQRGRQLPLAARVSKSVSLAGSFVATRQSAW